MRDAVPPFCFNFATRSKVYPITMKKTSLFIIILSLLCILSGREADAASAQGHRYAVVYLDPHYGGKENGPSIDRKIKGKDVTLALAGAVRRELLKQKIETFLSRDEDIFIPSGDRWFYAKKKGAHIYLSLRLKAQERDCVQLYYAKRPPLPRTTRAKNGYEAVISDPKVEAMVRESLRLSEALAKGLKGAAPAVCGTVQTKKDVLFETSDFPAVIIEFGAARRADQRSYVIDGAKVDAMAAAIAQAVKDFIKAEPTQ
jgi:N-acetylmuramoyl-L-alanine amidase